MLHDHVADYFGCAVHQTDSHQLQRLLDEGQEKWLRSHRFLVVVQQSGLQELIHSRQK
jgi:hypothetical protein